RPGPFLSLSTLLFMASGAVTIHRSLTMAGGTAMRGGWILSRVWMRMPGETWAGSGVRFVAMWLVMMVAMMLPPLVPMLASFRRNRLAALSGVAYFSVWALVGALVYVLGRGVGRAWLAWPVVARLAPLATGAALLLAGAVQVSAWKARQLAVCRACRAPASGDAAVTLLH